MCILNLKNDWNKYIYRCLSIFGNVPHSQHINSYRGEIQSALLQINIHLLGYGTNADHTEEDISCKLYATG